MVTRPTATRTTTPPKTTSTPRNTTVLLASALTLGLLLLYPTSSDNEAAHRLPGQALAPAGILHPSGRATPGPRAAATTTVVNGTSIGTQYGPVQVQLAVRSGHIVRATAIDYPQGGSHDRQNNGHAVPLLQQATLTAQNAHIDTVSGATYTSDGYRQSLQAALDAAHVR